jgi:O-antigen/teichoic acid export membrane protein
MPGYAKQADDPEGLRKTFLDAVSILILLVLPAGVGLILTAKWAVPIVLGTQWLDAIPIVQVICVYAIANALGSNTGALFLAIGKPKIVTWMATIQLVIVIPALLYGVDQAGAIGAAWAYVASYAVIVPLSYGIAMTQIRVNVAVFAGRLWRPAVGVAAMAIAVGQIAEQLPPVTGWPLLWQIGLVASAGAAVYGGLVLALWFAVGRPAGAENWLITRVLVRLPGYSPSDPRG